MTEVKSDLYETGAGPDSHVGACSQQQRVSVGRAAVDPMHTVRRWLDRTKTTWWTGMRSRLKRYNGKIVERVRN